MGSEPNRGGRPPVGPAVRVALPPDLRSAVEARGRTEGLHTLAAALRRAAEQWVDSSPATTNRGALMAINKARSVTVTFEGVDARGEGFQFSRTLDATRGGDNPRYYVQQLREAASQALDSIEGSVVAHYGKVEGDKVEGGRATQANLLADLREVLREGASDASEAGAREAASTHQWILDWLDQRESKDGVKEAGGGHG